MELAKSVNQNKLNITVVNSYPFLDSNESYSSYVLDDPRFPKLVDINNIVLYLQTGYIMLESQTTLKSQQANNNNKKLSIYFSYYMSNADQQESSAHCCHSGAQAHGNYILTYTSPIISIGKERSGKGRKCYTYNFYSHTMKARFLAPYSFNKREKQQYLVNSTYDFYKF